MRRVVHLWIFNILHLQLRQAFGIECTVTQKNGWTTYSIPEFTATNCEFSWVNKTILENHVLANHKGKLDDLVRMSNRSMLVTKGCFEWTLYHRDCTSEDTPQEANCTTTCSGNAKPWINGEELMTPRAAHRPEPEPGAAVPRHYWATFAVVCLLVLMLLFLCYKCRDHRCRCLYTDEKNNQPNMV